jgi:hypothetical protein
MARKLLLPLFAAAMLAFAIFHVVRAQQLRPRPEPPRPPAAPPFVRRVAGVGLIEAETENIAIAPAPGLIAEVLVRDGETVAKDAAVPPRWPAARSGVAQPRGRPAPLRPGARLEAAASGGTDGVGSTGAGPARVDRKSISSTSAGRSMSEDDAPAAGADVTGSNSRAAGEHQALVAGASGPGEVAWAGVARPRPRCGKHARNWTVDGAARWQGRFCSATSGRASGSTRCKSTAGAGGDCPAARARRDDEFNLPRSSRELPRRACCATQRVSFVDVRAVVPGGAEADADRSIGGTARHARVAGALRPGPGAKGCMPDSKWTSTSAGTEPLDRTPTPAAGPAGRTGSRYAPGRPCRCPRDRTPTCDPLQPRADEDVTRPDEVQQQSVRGHLGVIHDHQQAQVDGVARTW